MFFKEFEAKLLLWVWKIWFFLGASKDFTWEKDEWELWLFPTALFLKPATQQSGIIKGHVFDQ